MSINPPFPVGYQLIPQSVVNADMTAWAVEILRSVSAYSMFASTTRWFGARSALARVGWHPANAQITTVHRGVTLYEARDPVTAPPSTELARGIDVSGYQPLVDWRAVAAPLDANASRRVS